MKTLITIGLISSGVPAILFVIAWWDRGLDAAWDRFYNFVGEIVD